MAAPPIAERHKHHFHRQAPIKESVRAATTANITIATALNNGDTLDGVTLATGDRVLVKNQSSDAENGVYVVGATPARDYDVSSDDPAFGYLVYVREGTANGGKVFRNTNTSAPTIDTTALTFAEVAVGSSLTVENEGTPLATAATTLDFVGQGVNVTGAGAEKTITIPGEDTSYVEVAATGATETVDCSVARTYDLTLTADCTITLAGAVNNEAHFVTVVFRQDGTGGRTVTHPGSVVWATGSAPTIDPDPAAVTWVMYVSFDGGTVWFGFPIGGGGTMSHDALDDVSPDDHHDQTHDLLGGDHTFTGLTAGDVLTATSATEAEFLPPSGGATHFEVLLTEDGTEPITTEDGLDWLYVEVPN